MDYDSLSPTFGIEEGFVSQLDISALGPAGLVNFDLSGTPTYTQNLGTIWDINIPLAGLSIPFTTNFSGTLEFNSVISPFTGIFDGTLTFFDDGSQAIEGALTFDTDFGTASGNLSANADPVLMSVPVPEASSSLGLLALGTLGTVPTLKRKLKSSRNHQ